MEYEFIIEYGATDNSEEEILGRSAQEYVHRAFENTNLIKRTAAFAARDVRIFVPLDMPLIQESDILRALKTMRVRRLDFLWLGGRGDGYIRIGAGEENGVFLQENCFLRIRDAKSYNMVYNLLKYRIVDRLLAQGVHIPDSASVFIDDTVLVAPTAAILPFTRLCGSSRIAAGASISASYVDDSTVDENASVCYSHLHDSRVRKGASVGPFARLRSADIGEDCRIGDFVEIKASNLERGVKAAHLSYVGDAEVGESTNVGCGTVFCNFDGANKHRTQVGKDCFIGANTNLIAPIEIGDGAFIAAGTTVSRNVEKDSFTIGRVRQETKKK